jgi:uncharacterized membrane protein
MQYRVTQEIQAAAEAVWDVLVDVTQWPSWSPTMARVRRLDDGPFGFNSAAEVSQPRLPKNVWRVTEYEPGRRFEWATRSPGLEIRGDHLIEPVDAARCRVTLNIQSTGPLARVVELCYGRLNRRYVDLEASSLKRRCETAT